MRRGKFKPERWRLAQELASRGYTVCRAAREIGIHHATAIYMAQRMGFKWGFSLKGKYPRRKESTERVERMMYLVSK